MPILVGLVVSGRDHVVIVSATVSAFRSRFDLGISASAAGSHVGPRRSVPKSGQQAQDGGEIGSEIDH